jgi:hypothetical protein
MTRRYAVDSLTLLLQSIVAGPALYEFKVGYDKALTVCVYLGMLVGAIFWGLGTLLLFDPSSQLKQ